MKKTLLLLILINQSLFAQKDAVDDLMGFTGPALEGMSGLQFGVLPNSDEDPFSTLFGFFPRYNFHAPKNWYSFSVGAPMGFGVSFGYTSSLGSTYNISADLPVTLDINLGHHATASSNVLFGGFFGIGAGYNFTKYNYFGIRYANLHSLGPVIHGGFRWIYAGRPTGFRIAYMPVLSSNYNTPDGIVQVEKFNPYFITISLVYKVF